MRLKKLVIVFLALVLLSVVFVYIATHHTNDILRKILFRKGYYPDLYPCHYTKLPPRYYGDNDLADPNILCRQRRPSKSSCEKAIGYFGSPSEKLVDPKCPSPLQPDICWYTSLTDPTLNCSPTVCSNTTIYLGKRDLTLGDIRHWTSVKPFRTSAVVKFVEKAVSEGETFCFMKCGGIIQVLVFPPILYMSQQQSNSTSNINVNIVLIDSLSRSHFYRMMRNSIGALRGLMESEAVTVLDFEMLQSIGTHTFENLRALFSGKVDYRRTRKSSEIGHGILNQYYKYHGYQTIFQEDLCWFDRWGTVLDDIQMKFSSKCTKARWSKFKKIISKHAIDNYGITFFSCEVFKTYNETNHFEYPAKVCLNGKFFNSYFLQYLQDVTQTVKLFHNAPPYLSYTHLSTAHTATGIRIRNMDEPLTQFIRNVGRDPLTWTIIMADHGHKTTQYVRSTAEGQYEATNPLLFMIVPQRMSQMLGKERMSALVKNQNRLITTMDLHRTLTSFLDAKNAGLFLEIPANRTCTDVPIMPLAKCQCHGNELRYKDNSPKLAWMAEFALGQLNNMIENQLLKGKVSPVTSHCRRLIGSSFTSIIQTGSQTTLDLHINASRIGLAKPEVFKVAVLTTNKGAKFQSFERLTIYNKFQTCVEKSVDIKLCMCDVRPAKKNVKHALEIKAKMFQSRVTTTEELYKKCLFKVIRNYKDGTFAIEVVNKCRRESFGVYVGGYTEQVFLSSSLPLQVKVMPLQTKFLLSAVKQSIHNHVDLNFEVTKLKL